MTDSELIKALENKVQGSDYACFEDYEILDLIKRQKAELEAIKDKKAMVFKLSEEQINELKEDVLKSVEYNERKIKVEAYKEFAEIINDKWFDNRYDSPDVDFDDFISNLLKEMVGETDD